MGFNGSLDGGSLEVRGEQSRRHELLEVQTVVRGDHDDGLVPPRLVKRPKLGEDTRQMLAEQPGAEPGVAARFLEVEAMPRDVSDEKVLAPLLQADVDDLAAGGVAGRLDEDHARSDA